MGEALLFQLRARNDEAVQGRADRCQWSQLSVLQRAAAAAAAAISARAQLTGGPIKLPSVDIHHFDLFCYVAIALKHLSSHYNAWRRSH